MQADCFRVLLVLVQRVLVQRVLVQRVLVQRVLVQRVLVQHPLEKPLQLMYLINFQGFINMNTIEVFPKAFVRARLPALAIQHNVALQI